MELLIGHTLFQTHDDLEHLAMIEALLGPMPAGLRSRALATKQGTSFIRANGTIKFPGAATSMQSIRAVERIRGLSQSLTRQTNPSISAKVARLLVGAYVCSFRGCTASYAHPCDINNHSWILVMSSVPLSLSWVICCCRSH